LFKEILASKEDTPMRTITWAFAIHLCAILLLTSAHPASGGKGIPPDTRNGNLTLTIVYDNNPYDPALETRWGFSCYIKGAESTVLFDVGGDGSVLMGNMAKLGIDPRTVDAVVLSHVHHDHIGGLSRFLSHHSSVTVYMPRSLPPSVKETVRLAGAHLVEVHGPREICSNVYSTGEMGGFIKEESLVIRTSKGLIVITGCAHPGIVDIVERAKEILKSDVYLVLGGFHLCWMDLSGVKKIITGVKRAGCKKVGPCHCSGDLARKQFENVYGDDFIRIGVGKTITIEHAF
jgi:7,8-dihydropterin-6-yl-methyl-4-(beta-D-ribofuranosyl)aminobenzene 5'-phosphate synthase